MIFLQAPIETLITRNGVTCKEKKKKITTMYRKASKIAKHIESIPYKGLDKAAMWLLNLA